MDSSQIPSPKPRFLPVRLMAVLVLSCSAAALVWSRPPAPTWITDDIPGHSNPVGFTSDGLLISLDSAENFAVKSRLRIREAATGKVVQEHVLGTPLNSFAELTPDGEWVILRTGNAGTTNQLMVVSWRTGLPRYPPITVDTANPTPMSPDGRYKMVYFEEHEPKSNLPASIVNLTTGRILYSTGTWQVQFSPDSSQWVGLVKENGQQRLVFHAIEDGRELGRSAPLIIPDDNKQRLSLGRWTADRLEVEAPFYPTPKSKIYDRRTWSFQVNGTQLSDMLAELAYSGHVDVPRDSQTWWDAGDGWAARTGYARIETSSLVKNWNDFQRGWPIAGKLYWHSPHLFYHWQMVSPKTGKPIARAVYSEGREFLASKDGRWLAAGGEKLRVWKLPPTPGWRRMLWALLAAAIPWVLMLRLRPKVPLSKVTANAGETTESVCS